MELAAGVVVVALSGAPHLVTTTEDDPRQRS